MARKFISLGFLLLFSSGISAQQSAVNSIIGDSSWFAAKACWPDANDSEQERISTHLQYVHQRLSNANPKTHLKRKALLEALADYIKAGAFPLYFEYPAKRRPCFIDDAGTLCAVGHLIAVSKGRAEAERINRKYRFEYIVNMQDSALLEWQKESGFSLKELAMIQPNYGIERHMQPPYFLFQDPQTLLYGLKRRKDDRVIIPADFEILRHDPTLPFVFGKRNMTWDVFLPNGRILGIGYQKTSFIRNKQHFRMICSQAEITEAFNASGELVWQEEGCQFLWSWEHQIVVQDLNQQKRKVLNWNGHQISPWADSISPLPGNYNQFVAWKCENKNDARPFTVWDTLGNKLLPDSYAKIEAISGCFIAQKDENSALEVFLSNGKELELPGLRRYEKGIHSYGLILHFDSLSGVLNSQNGEWLLEPEYNKVFATNSHYHFLSANGQGKADAAGNIIIPPEYESIIHLSRHHILRKNGKMELRDYNGKVILPLAYDSLGILMDDPRYNNLRQLYFSQDGDRFRIHNQEGEIMPEHEYRGFDRLNPNIVLLHKDGKKILAQYYNGEIILYPHLPIDYARPLNAWYFAYGLNGKEGVLVCPPAVQPSAEHFGKAIFDTVLQANYRDAGRYLVRKENLWGVYDKRGDSLLIPCLFDDFYPKDRTSHSGWIYFKKDSAWQGYFYSSPKLQNLMPEGEAKIEALWREENEELKKGR